jgi:large subunit ribosomal protein L10Ae
MSKISNEIIEEAVAEILKLAGEKKRKFVETIELQVGLKNYDPVKEKRFAGTIRLPHIPRERFSVCVLGTDKDCDDAKANAVPCMSVADLTKLNKNKKLVKKLAASHGAFLASSSLIRKIPRLLGPGLNKAGKFPTVISSNETMQANVDNLKASVKFQLKSKKTTCLGVPVGSVALTAEENVRNILLAINFLVSLLPKNWQQVKRMYLKSTMGPSVRVFGF